MAQLLSAAHRPDAISNPTRLQRRNEWKGLGAAAAGSSARTRLAQPHGGDNSAASAVSSYIPATSTTIMGSAVNVTLGRLVDVLDVDCRSFITQWWGALSHVSARELTSSSRTTPCLVLT